MTPFRVQSSVSLKTTWIIAGKRTTKRGEEMCKEIRTRQEIGKILKFVQLARYS